MVTLLALLACAPVSSDTASARRPAAVDVSSAALDWAPVAASAAAPMGLTASDGTGLRLVSLDVRAVVEDPLAFTELHLVFENPEDRVLEGRFEITLPPGAAVSRFAMKLGDLWQEGEVVELQAARRAYEDFLHRRSDPALLEFDAGNEFTARVFPIPAKGKKELILSWSHDLDATEAWTLPTGGLPELGRLTAEVGIAGRTLTMDREYAVPEGDLSLVVPRTSGAASARAGDVAVIRVQPELAVDRDPIRSATILFDTSASRALALEASLGTLRAVAGTLDPKAPLTVVAYDQTHEVVYSGPAGSLKDEVLGKLRTRGALGASDLVGALAAVKGERLVVITDGVVTAGPKASAELRAAVAGLPGVQRADVIVSGGARDEALLGELVTAGLPRHGVVLDADRIGPPEIGRRLGLGASGTMDVAVPGAEWSWPESVSGIQPGDSVTIYAKLPEQSPLGLQIDGRDVPLAAARAMSRPLIARGAAQAEIARLQHLEAQATDREERKRIAERMVAVSTRNRVLSPHTALLVLETEGDYERFGIPRNALTDILTVQNGDLVLQPRGTPVFGNAEAVEPPRDESREAEGEAKDEQKAKKSAEADDDLRDAFDGAPMEEREAAGPPPSAPSAERAPRADQAEESRRPSRSRPRPPAEDPPPPPPPPGDMGGEMESDEEEVAQPPADPLAGWEGPYREVMADILGGRLAEAEARARRWLAESPGDPLALLALGEVLERTGRPEEAARVYGSLIDLFPSRADLRRLAGERLETLGAAGVPLAVDTYRTAVEQRIDHPSGHRNLAWALVRQDRHADAIAVLAAAKDQEFGRFEAAHRILAEDAAIIGAAWRAKDPSAPVAAALKPLGVEPATTHALRFVLNWETDANDVDFHIYDGKGGHAYYSDRELPSGGTLYADITSGYGPECFAIPKPGAFPYRLQAHYYSRGPMGFGMGKLQIVEHDGKGRITIEDRPFVVMTDGAYVPLGEVTKSSLR